VDALNRILAQRDRWTEKEQTQAEVEVLIIDNVYTLLPSPPFTDEEKQEAAKRIYQQVWQQSASGLGGIDQTAAWFLVFAADALADLRIGETLPIGRPS
jgi:hypothetical protein